MLSYENLRRGKVLCFRRLQRQQEQHMASGSPLRTCRPSTDGSLKWITPAANRICLCHSLSISREVQAPCFEVDEVERLVYLRQLTAKRMRSDTEGKKRRFLGVNYGRSREINGFGLPRYLHCLGYNTRSLRHLITTLPDAE